MLEWISRGLRCDAHAICHFVNITRGAVLKVFILIKDFGFRDPGISRDVAELARAAGMQTLADGLLFKDVPDIVSQEYEVPRLNVSDTPPPPFSAPPSRAPPPLHNFFPKPPPVPPPPEKYYAATEICKTGPQLPPPPPLSPPPALVPQLTSNNARGGGLYGLVGVGCNDTLTTTSSEEEEQGEVPELAAFSTDNLTILDKLGPGQFGEIHLCRVESFPDSFDIVSSSDCSLVIVKYLRIGASESARIDFQREVRSLARLQDPNIVRVLGACLDKEPQCMVVEFMEYGDLNQFLQEHIAETASTLPQNAKMLSYGCLIYMATQIASGMKYLESLSFVHRDLATRNCLVGRGCAVKVSDIAISRSLYSADYCNLEGKALPIRWMAWESILLGRFTSKSDVWSFAVTLWEILTFAREQPFDELSDDKLIENAAHFYKDDGQEILLPLPINCPKEIYDLMCECWQRNKRPNFREIHLFLQRKNLGYKPGMD
uniref:Protein kinase domain-containing protein n=1 Tax=Timema poppense TaxID=170557 RepID=A0A7R9CXV7_TIMPO|nr:unnamed protein product [Timema poppensis]